MTMRSLGHIDSNSVLSSLRKFEIKGTDGLVS